MANKKLEAQLVITAADKTGAVFNEVGARFDKLAAAGARIDGVGRNFLNVASAVDKYGNALANAGGQVDKLHSKMKEVDTLGRRIGNALGPIAAGYAAFESARVARGLSEHAARAAIEGQHERVRMEAAGMTPGEISAAEAAAARLSAEYTPLSQTTLLHMLRNARSITGSLDAAVKIMGPLAKLRILAQAAHPEQADELEGEFDRLIKGMEIKGVTMDPAKFTAYMQGMAKAINVFGDTLRPTDFYEMFKYGGLATQALSQQFMLETAPTFAQEMGGSRTGTALSMFYSKLIGDSMTMVAANELARFGLIDMSKVQSKAGRITKLHPGAVKGWELAAADPYRWVNEIFLPALARAHITDKDKILGEISTIFGAGRQSSGYLVGILATQQAKIEKNWEQARGAQGLEGADTFMSKDVITAWGSLTAQTRNFLLVAGGPLALPAAAGLNAIADSIGYLAEKVRENPAARHAATGALLGAIGTAGLAGYETFIGALRFGGAMEASTAKWLAQLPLRALGPASLLAGSFELYDWANQALLSAKGLSDNDKLAIASTALDPTGGVIAASMLSKDQEPPKAELKGDATLNVHVTIDHDQEPYWTTTVDGRIPGMNIRGTTGDLGKSWPDIER